MDGLYTHSVAREAKKSGGNAQGAAVNIRMFSQVAVGPTGTSPTRQVSVSSQEQARRLDFRTVSSLTDNVIENEIYEKSKQHKDDVTSFSESDISPPTQTTTHASSSSTLTLVSPQTSTLNNIPATNSKRPLQNIDNLDITPRRLIPIKKQKSDDLQTALIEALKEPIGQTTDPLDDFLARLGEGMRRLPYRVRARLEIEFLTLLAEKEACCTNNDLNDI
ncbi:uncharacterized protein LOC114255100 [Monomorium pharaonis]|uniref:uncharacterized protein LOC114255100 n=1 Tax=Monomorium pharaonis TaxID=307658 RepID=UPI001746549D|nr:uncharacterized protein LOC114255100 [Monomorium pharaonis]